MLYRQWAKKAVHESKRFSNNFPVTPSGQPMPVHTWDEEPGVTCDNTYSPTIEEEYGNKSDMEIKQLSELADVHAKQERNLNRGDLSDPW
ncbi:hypothetical protein [Bacillus sp. FJAT-45037]|uniref:hypothetical protein n=1 Tax=Bacillus sp. FJAT-45037 TaxID=2011007 RepID=UPI000C251031|nr:hypothetical protein [Bacillus sp. FJAT-45037]